jgi:hydrogenase maturation factor
MAEVDFGSRTDTVCLLYQPEAAVGAAVLVHMGFVMEELGEERAQDALALRKEIAGVPPQQERFPLQGGSTRGEAEGDGGQTSARASG